MSDKRIVKESRTRTLIRDNAKRSFTWAFAIGWTYLITQSLEWTWMLNVPIILFAVATGYFYERGWLRIKFGIER